MIPRATACVKLTDPAHELAGAIGAQLGARATVVQVDSVGPQRR